MQRVRIGLTGLASVFLLVVLAASLLGIAGEDEPPRGRSAVAAGSRAVPNTNSVAEDPKEPLAELGVAPGNAPEEGAPPASNAAAPAPTQPSSPAAN